MGYVKLNSRSIRLFVATPDEIEKRRPNLNATYFRISKDAIRKLADMSTKTKDGDVVCGMSIWKREGKDGKPDFFSGEVSYPDSIELQQKYLDKDSEWMEKHPATGRNTQRKANYAKRKSSEDEAVVDISGEVSDLPF